MKLVLFDIDGTLIHSDGVGSAATKLAMQEVFGTVGKLAEFRFGGKTDWQMLLETLDGLVSAEEIQRRLPEYDAVLGQHVTAILPRHDVRPCIGAPELLLRSVQDPVVTVGVLTANMPQTAFLKLRAAQYDTDVFEVTAFGSEATHRNGLPPLAIQRACALKRYDFLPDEVIVIGDTPEDIISAHNAGARVIAVATGRHPSAELAAYHPTALVENMQDTETIWSLVMG